MKRFWISEFGFWIRALATLSLLVGHPLMVGAQTLEEPISIQNPKSKIPNPSSASTIVVFNNLDPLSLDLAAYYAEKRGISLDHLIGLDCPLKEEISREEYDAKIAEPLRKGLADRGWWTVRKSGGQTRVEQNQIRFIVLMRGMPLKIGATTSYAGDKQDDPALVAAKNEAAVDSELATLGYFSRKISGVLNNPYYRSFTPFADAKFSSLMLVCRLDAPTPQIVKRMIDDSIAAEQDGLWGFAYVDSRGIADGGLAEGDKWLNAIAEDARTHGIPTIVDGSPEMFPTNYPMDHAALYFGWYNETVSGPFTRDDFHFVKGAIACHIHSWSAATIRDPHQNWVAPLLARGAAATLGNVYEPFLALTPNLDIFHERLREGFSFAESAYMSERVLSWMTTFVGDPLYRPFKVVQDDNDKARKSAAEWIAYREGALTWFNQNRAAGEQKLKNSTRELRSGIICEGLGLLQASAGDASAAQESFAQARNFYADTSDVLRTAIHEVNLLKAAHRTREALALARQQIKAHPNAPAAAILRAIELELAPPPNTPKPANATR